VRILLTGRSGQVGSALARALAPLGELIALDRRQLDLQSIGDEVSKAKPDVIVNAAAYTAVDRAEQEREAAFAVNAEGVGRIAQEARAMNALLVHFSTDYVFDGEKMSPYVEADPPNPLNVYGQSKLQGERAIAASGCRHFIFRTSWVYAPVGRNFMNAILAAAKARPTLSVVSDQHGAPTSSLDIAGAVAETLADADLRIKPSGVYHLCAAGETTWHGFAEALLKASGISTPVVPIRSDEYPTAAKRPKNSRLNCAKAAATFGVALPDWREGLAAVLRAVH
jgi:dTDP-4-dehydrorhamnose reductase